MLAGAAHVEPARLLAAKKHMKPTHIERQFVAMGARFKISDAIVNQWRQMSDYAIDIQKDRRGEFFELRVARELREKIEVAVLQAKPRDRHLLLFVTKRGEPEKDRFLCGHDERAWFVAAVPGTVSTIAQAKEALKPQEVRMAQSAARVSSRKKNLRKNDAFRRQGEWFFVPAPMLVVEQKLVLHNEPIRRGAGKAHILEQAYRTGGERVYVHAKYPNGVSEKEYERILARKDTTRGSWRVMVRNAAVYGRGTVRHPDHKTITLHNWHRVLMNTETQTRSMANVAFLD